ncbi:MAG: DUF2283 domain-containing protein [Thaumarchaeota archaeon]|jgi:hypothetical protein|nr:DUF2283 domain-containing protein [Nitrososphaerota archaeon]
MRDGDIVDSIEVREKLIVDFDKNGEVIGIEVINFSKSKIDIGGSLARGFNPEFQDFSSVAFCLLVSPIRSVSRFRRV